MASNPHDALFKAIFERPENAQGELRSILPRPLAEAIDWTRHKHVPEVVAPWVKEWVDLMRALHTPDDVRPLSRYVYEVKGADEVQLFLSFIAREVGLEAREIMKSFADELIELGLERGLSEGIEQGKMEGEREVLLKVLRQRFGSLTPEMEQRIATATGEQLEAWTTRVLSAATLADVLLG